MIGFVNGFCKDNSRLISMNLFQHTATLMSSELEIPSPGMLTSLREPICLHVFFILLVLSFSAAWLLKKGSEGVVAADSLLTPSKVRSMYKGFKMDLRPLAIVGYVHCAQVNHITCTSKLCCRTGHTIFITYAYICTKFVNTNPRKRACGVLSPTAAPNAGDQLG